MDSVAPSSSQIEDVLQNFEAMDLLESDNFRVGRWVQDELGEFFC